MKPISKPQPLRHYRVIELAIHSLATVLVVALLPHFSRMFPVEFTRFISEDQWGEYATSVAFAFCVLLSLGIVKMSKDRWNKAVWILIALGAFFIAGEEISWGQRIFNVHTPKVWQELNRQGELTLHNLYIFKPEMLHSLVGLFTGGWLLVSLVVFWAPAKIEKYLTFVGFPVIPISLFPFFVLVIYLWFLPSVQRSDEIGELFLGLSMAILALKHYMRLNYPDGMGEAKAVGLTGLLIALIVAIALVLPQFTQNSRWGWPLNHTAAHVYPSSQMFDQSEKIFEYIYANPQYIQADTRIRHGRMLLHAEKPAEAKDMLSRAVIELEARQSKRAIHWLHLGVANALMGQEGPAELALEMSLKTYQSELDMHPGNDQSALSSWWSARTSMARGDKKAALEFAYAARGLTDSFKLKRDLNIWITCVSTTEFYQPWNYYQWIEFLNCNL
jgi:hypothetical protein